MTMTNYLTLPMYAKMPQRKIAGTDFVAVTTYKSYDGTVANYMLFTADGGVLGNVHYQPESPRSTRGYTLTTVERMGDEKWGSLAEAATVLAERLGLSA